MDITVKILQKWYNEFNESMFHGVLLPVEIKLTKHKRRLGSVSTIRGSNKVKTLTVSNLLRRDIQGYKNTLADEIIHVFQVQNKLPLKHDNFFMLECDRINKAFPEFSLEVATSMDEIVSNVVIDPNKVVVAVKIGDYATFMTQKTYDSAKNLLGRRVLSMFNHFTQEEINNCKVSIIPSAHAKAYTVHRSTTSLTYTLISKKVGEIIENKGELLLK